ncbi:MAG: response regulator, partial [Bacteroidota bacterium]|nr:response regulator [Bacteroidota bacterium]
KEAGIRINNNIVNGIVQDNQGLIWVGTDHGGINLIDKKTNHISFIKNETENSRSLSENTIYSLYKSKAGLIWAGTFKSGVNLFDANAINFPLYKNHLSDKNSLPFNDVNRFVEDEKRNIWIGSNGGGLIYFDRKSNTFKTYKHDPRDANSLTNDIIVGLYYDKDHKLWIGTYFGGMDCYDGKTFHHYKHDPANINSIADDRVWDIYEDAEQNFWIATLGGGMDKYDRKKNIFYHNQVRADGNGVRSNDITHIAKDNAGDLWLATSNGIDILNLKTLQFAHLSDSANNLSSFTVNTIFCDSKGLVWAGTREGLDVYNVLTKKFQPFTTADGLPYNNVLNIVEDNSGFLWISTPNGISRIKTIKEANGDLKIACRNFNAKDGLQSSEFNPNAALKTTAGEIIFGGPSGFNLFNPKSIKDVNNKVNVVFTDLQVLNKSIVPDEKVNGNIVLKESIITAKEITLKYDQDIFSIEFASLNFIDPDKNRYAYKLEGFNKDWAYADENSKRVTYTNLDPGTYTFYVKAANDAGEWSAITTQLKITVLPPFWKTNFAYFLYFLFLIVILFFIRRSIRQKFAIEEERREALRMHELDMMKIKFFTNVSHEFRTPLSLIITPLDKIINTTSDLSKKKHFELMQRNARRLLNLVNQLLDFRKLETQEIKLNSTKGNIIKFLNEISFSFTDMAEKKEIKFSFHSSVQSLYTFFDIDKLERIMFNLLSNAFKFTPEHGNIEVNVNCIDTSSPFQKIVEIRVKDSGIGIPPEKHEKIFERFFQNEVPGSMLNQGSGIGLSITKEFVKLHGGNISVESEVEKGSCFIVQLPVTIVEEQIADMDETVVNDTRRYHDIDEEIIPEINLPVLSSKKATLLLIEDNEDFRFYLKDNLKQFYNIIEAGNGKEGWQKALQFHPDLIVSDIMMPVMDGLELCNKIKTDSRTSHIPVILLTAKTTEENKLEGYQTGASDYITKPFNFEILQSRIKNILSHQASLRKTFQKHVEAKPTELAVSSENEKFIQQALEIVEKNIDNTDFSVEELSKGLYMSRVGFYKKIFAITGKTPIEFIRSIRLKRAAQLLSKTQMTIAEVAYEVGFNNPKYFAKYFKAEYGMLPSAYQNEQQNKV